MLYETRGVTRSSHVPARASSTQAPAAAPNSTPQRQALSFGQFRLDPVQRCLTECGKVLPLGGRAFDVLEALVARRGNIISKSELKDCVWPGRIVEDNTLHAQISMLRRACASNRDLIKTVAGRGYRLTAVVEDADPDDGIAPAAPATRRNRLSASPNNLPASTFTIMGRACEINAIAGLLLDHRLISLLGPGGIGKSRLGLAAAHQLLPDFSGGVWILDLASLTDGEQVAGAIGATLGLPHVAFARKPAGGGLGGEPTLLVLDNCEHLIDAASHAAESLLQTDSAIRVMVTSREALRADGERIFQVPSLAVPNETDPDGDSLGQHAAVRLFIDRVKAAGLDLALSRHTASAIGEICRRLEGNPLAIELAASRAATIGVDELAQRLDDRFRLLTSGRRLAAPRHRSLAASLEWSYRLLSERERTVLRRLAVFSGSFTLDSARAIATGPGVSEPDVDECVTNLIAKSLMTADVRGTAALYRLSETTQIFAREKLADGDSADPSSLESPAIETAAWKSDEAPPDRRVNVVTRLTFGGQAKAHKLAGSFAMKAIDSGLVAS